MSQDSPREKYCLDAVLGNSAYVLAPCRPLDGIFPCCCSKNKPVLPPCPVSPDLRVQRLDACKNQPLPLHTPGRSQLLFAGNFSLNIPTHQAYATEQVQFNPPPLTPALLKI